MELEFHQQHWLAQGRGVNHLDTEIQSYKQQIYMSSLSLAVSERFSSWSLGWDEQPPLQLGMVMWLQPASEMLEEEIFKNYWK